MVLAGLPYFRSRANIDSQWRSGNELDGSHLIIILQIVERTTDDVRMIGRAFEVTRTICEWNDEEELQGEERLSEGVMGLCANHAASILIQHIGTKLEVDRLVRMTSVMDIVDVCSIAHEMGRTF